MFRFRQCFSLDQLEAINEAICEEEKKDDDEAREKTESYIDILYELLKGKIDKPRTYRKVARTEYLATAKKRKPGKKQLRRAIRKQLGYVYRNLKQIERLGSYYYESPLTISQSQILETIKEL